MAKKRGKLKDELSCSWFGPLLHQHSMFWTFFGVILLIISLHSRSKPTGTSGIRRCPITSDSRYVASKNYLYPLEIYHAKDQRKSFPNTTNCYCKDFIFRTSDVHFKRRFTCPSSYAKCPVSYEHIQHASERSKTWNKVSNMCSLKSYLNNASEVVNVILFGGSATVGVMAHGCCTRPECVFNGTWAPECTWPSFFVQWLQNTYPAKIRFVNLAFGGYDSVISMEKVGEMFTEKEVGGLTGRDLILMDHSYNDMLFGRKHLIMSLDRAVETLVRRLLQRVESAHDPPHLVLLEMDARHVFEDHRYHYTTSYSRVAAHYGLRLISLHDAVWSQLQWKVRSDTSSDGGTPPEGILYQHLLGTQDVRNDTHPPWHVHLFHAELIAASIQKEFHQCEKNKSGSAVISAPMAPGKYVLPKSQIEIDETKQCNPQYAPQLRLNYDSVTVNKHKAIGQFSVPINNTWQVRKDRKGRGGFIRELSSHSNCTLEGNAPLHFTLNLTVGQLELIPDNLVLQLMYLRGYSNAGIVEIDYCGKTIFGGIDALWMDYTTHKYTIPQVSIIPLETHFCTEQAADKNASVTLTIRHRIQECEYFKGDMSVIIKTEPRLAQMFKINSVSVCRYY